MQKQNTIGCYYSRHGAALAYDVMHAVRQHARLSERRRKSNFPEVEGSSLASMAHVLRCMHAPHIAPQAGATGK